MVGSGDAWGHHPWGMGSWDLESDEWGLQWGEWRLHPGPVVPARTTAGLSIGPDAYQTAY